MQVSPPLMVCQHPDISSVSRFQLFFTVLVTQVFMSTNWFELVKVLEMFEEQSYVPVLCVAYTGRLTTQ